jgi:hypothetical protein
MRRGDFELAWQISDSVLRERLCISSNYRPRKTKSLWTGTPLAGKQVSIRCYHGLGDTIQFIRYALLLQANTAQLTVWAQSTLITLLQTVRGIDRILPLHRRTAEGEHEVDVEVMELPYIFRTTLETIPAAVPYIEVDAAPMVEENLVVGIAWRGGYWDRRRDISFSLIRNLAEIPGVTFYVFAKISRQCHDRFKRVIDYHSDALTTARIMRGLDLVISIDSMLAHLARALGLPTWTLLSTEADWRWMEDREDSPWYPTMRLFRQSRPGEWEPVLERVAVELARLTNQRTKNTSRPATDIGGP